MLQHYRYKIPEVDDTRTTKGLGYKRLIKAIKDISEVQDLGDYMVQGRGQVRRASMLVRISGLILSLGPKSLGSYKGTPPVMYGPLTRPKHPEVPPPSAELCRTQTQALLGCSPCTHTFQTIGQG